MGEQLLSEFEEKCFVEEILKETAMKEECSGGANRKQSSPQPESGHKKQKTDVDASDESQTSMPMSPMKY